jgi:translation initiation factor IF-2
MRDATTRSAPGPRDFEARSASGFRARPAAGPARRRPGPPPAPISCPFGPGDDSACPAASPAPGAGGADRPGPPARCVRTSGPLPGPGPPPALARPDPTHTAAACGFAAGAEPVRSGGRARGPGFPGSQQGRAPQAVLPAADADRRLVGVGAPARRLGSGLPAARPRTRLSRASAGGPYSGIHRRGPSDPSRPGSAGPCRFLSWR